MHFPKSQTLSNLKTWVIGTTEETPDCALLTSDPPAPPTASLSAYSTIGPATWGELGAQSVFLEESANVLSSYFLHLFLLTLGDR